MIDHPEALREAVARWVGVSELAFDTEFVRERTYYARLGLIQVFDGHEVALIDPVALTDLSPLSEVLEHPGVLKIAHSASEDLSVLRQRLGVLPRPLFDTQIAASLVGMSPPPGYQRLIVETLGVTLAKEETRTDWVRRPLSAGQLAYAAEDVEHLLPAFHKLRERLHELGRWPWAIEDSAALVEDAAVDEAHDEVFLRFRSAARLAPGQQAMLRDLAAWREDEAKRRDLPRRFVLNDDLLFDLATKRPKTTKDLTALKSYDARQADRYATELLRHLTVRGEVPAPTAALIPPDLRPDQKRRLEALREVVAKEAERLGVRADVLANRRPLERLVRGQARATAEAFTGWRVEVLSPVLDPVLSPPKGL
jgi:ribonuclease D